MNKTKKQKLPIGLDDFQKLRTNDFYYVDKTNLIRELLENWGEVNLFTRPRRFGKTLNMSMLRHFFEIGTDPSLFAGLAIEKETELCKKHQGKYPVIFLSLRTVEGDCYERAMAQFCDVVAKEAMRFRFLEESDRLSRSEKALYGRLTKIETRARRTYAMTESDLANSLNTLSTLLCRHYGQKVVILIDEYDVPLAKANEHGYYKQMVMLVRNFLHGALKTNEHVFFSVLTGCLRISRESIFTGLNNLSVYSLLNQIHVESFGFTEREVRQMLSYYGFSQYYDVTKEWYDGYQIGGCSVYNPWDVINWVNQLYTEFNDLPKSYWMNSSSNREVQRFIRRMGTDVNRAHIERLISGGTVQKEIEEQLTYDSVYDNADNLWSLLFSAGYLTPGEPPIGNLMRLRIPNEEVRQIFQKQLLGLFQTKVQEDGDLANAFCNALKAGDATDAGRLLEEHLKKTVSIRDTAIRTKFKESFYHGIVLTILSFKSDWYISSNQESGDGYYDIAVEIPDEEIGILIELKYAEKGAFDAQCAAALRQIDQNKYMQELVEDGMQTIFKYGIACQGKKCQIVMEKEDLQ